MEVIDVALSNQSLTLGFIIYPPRLGFCYALKWNYDLWTKAHSLTTKNVKLQDSWTSWTYSKLNTWSHDYDMFPYLLLSQYSLVPPVILSFWAASPSLIQAINSSLAGSSFIQIAIFYCHNDILQILNISETGGDLIWKKIHSKKKLSKARIVVRHSFPDKWHLKSNDFFLFCGQAYLIHFSFQQCTKSSCKEMEG